MSDQKKRVRDFFDRGAERYRSKPSSTTDLYFSQRLELAIELATPRPKDRILDVGCGTGLLYHQLCDPVRLDVGPGRFVAPKKYLGIDFSTGMLEKSGIPENRRQEISLEDFHATTPSTEQFDLIFALGLTTYLSRTQFENFHCILAERLAPGGRAVVSYTHAASYDFRLRNWLNRSLGRWFPTDTSLGRDFPILATQPERVRALLPSQIAIQEVRWLPPVFPGLHLLPAGVRVLLNGRNSNNLWSGDFLLLLSGC